MTVRIRHEGSRVVIDIVGDFDLRTAHEPYDAVSTLLAGGEPISEVVVDLRGVDFVDSTGLGGLVRLQHEARQHDTPLVLREPGPRLRQLFEMTGLSHEFTIEAAEPEPDDAVRG
ncbi:STAS domain-containing protein [Jatrophihabitans sp. YIM 134969]